MSVHEIAERCWSRIQPISGSGDEIEVAIRAAAAPLVEALGDVLWLIDSGSVVLPDDDGPNTVTAREVCGAAHAALAAFKAQDETQRAKCEGFRCAGWKDANGVVVGRHFNQTLDANCPTSPECDCECGLPFSAHQLVEVIPWPTDGYHNSDNPR